ncbi:hypothetical protein [Nocardioides acrostichi]|uniref:Uncharacterized protein n=1 Tax=Nocardioides acrostichi TaxID=2784339 RepID=A0A930USX7_9ACTN|nr:hypothetical protein [Nocardioides acrostichi]MBF4160258.1 hypothetical protein [Nocardioides acrostichi]
MLEATTLPQTVPERLPVGGLGLVDLVVALLVLFSVLGALRRRAGLLAAVASGAVTLVVAWLVCWGLATWGPVDVVHQVRESRLVAVAPFPHQAARDLGSWG